MKITELKQNYNLGKLTLENAYFKNTRALSVKEEAKKPYRYDVINFLIAQSTHPSPIYLEIGVRNPVENFDKIKCKKKYSVDPGIEFKENPVDFKLTSDAFFMQLQKGKILSEDIRFDVVFIDGLHTADQVERDIQNALKYVTDDGFIVLHDCNPPTEYHAREDHNFTLSPAGNNWNGTVWKAFYKMRLNKMYSSCCIDSDWGIGIISKIKMFEALENDFNPFFEYAIFEKKRKKSLNLISFDSFSQTLKNRRHK